MSNWDLTLRALDAPACTVTVGPAQQPSGGGGSYGTGTAPKHEAQEGPEEEAPPESVRFRDVPAGAWYEDAVYQVCGRGLFRGTGENTFSPQAAMTRAMFVAVLHRLSGEPAAGRRSPQLPRCGGECVVCGRGGLGVGAGRRPGDRGGIPAGRAHHPGAAVRHDGALRGKEGDPPARAANAHHLCRPCAYQRLGAERGGGGAAGGACLRAQRQPLCAKGKLYPRGGSHDPEQATSSDPRGWRLKALERQAFRKAVSYRGYTIAIDGRLRRS